MDSLISRVDQLATFWQPRVQQVKQWYKLLRLENDLRQPGMESVISPDPRTSFNMAQWLLTPKAGGFTPDVEGLSEDDVNELQQVAGLADAFMQRAWADTETALFGSALHHMVRLMLATGWYAVMSHPYQEPGGEQGWVFRVMNPATVYPEYGAEGRLTAVGRSYVLSGRQAAMKVAYHGWQLPQNARAWRPEERVLVRVLWEEREGAVGFGVAMNDWVVKPMTVTNFPAIPIQVAPVGGLPDDDGIMGDNQWVAEVGQGILAPVVELSKNYNHMLTYMQQLLRDTANPKWVEKLRSGSQGVLTPEALNKRGAVFSLGVDEDLGPIPTPSIPPEMRAHQFDMRQMLQRALFSDTSFGAVNQQISGFLMSQVTASAQQILAPFHDGIESCLSATATMNSRLMRLWNMVVLGKALPAVLDTAYIRYKYQLQIPGDFLQRSNAARLLNPMFKLSSSTLYEVLFPEVRSGLREIGRIRAEEAVENPVVRAVLAVHELERASRTARANQDEGLADMLDRAAQLIEQQSLQPQQQEPVGAAGQPQEGIRGLDLQSLLEGK